MLARIEAQVFAHNGTLEKYVGDAVLAVFGAPVAALDDARRAFICACEIHQSIARWNLERATQALPPLQIGIGIDFGDVVGGTIGRDRNMTYAIVGEPVNRASRLQALSRLSGAPLVVSESFKAALETAAMPNPGVVFSPDATEPGVWHVSLPPART